MKNLFENFLTIFHKKTTKNKEFQRKIMHKSIE